MLNVIQSTVTGKDIVTWLVIALIVLYFFYKEWPEFWKRVTSKTKAQLTSEEVTEKVKKIDEKLERDYQRLNHLEARVDDLHKEQNDSKEESEIMMRAMLGVLKGLQELGTNGVTNKSEQEIQEYLNRKAHE